MDCFKFNCLTMNKYYDVLEWKLFYFLFVIYAFIKTLLRWILNKSNLISKLLSLKWEMQGIGSMFIQYMVVTKIWIM